MYVRARFKEFSFTFWGGGAEKNRHIQQEKKKQSNAGWCRDTYDVFFERDHSCEMTRWLLE